MPLPSARTLTATYTLAGGAAAAGFVLFTPSQRSAVTGTVQPSGAVRADLDSAGSISVALSPTDAAAWLAPGWTYHVVESISGAPVSEYDIAVPAAGSGNIDLATLAPVVDPTEVTPYVLRTQIGAPGGVASYSHSHGGEGGAAPTWDDIEDKPATFPPSTHTHPQSDVTGLVAALAATDAEVTALQGDVSDLDDRVTALESAPGGGGGSTVTTAAGYVTSGDVVPPVATSWAAITTGPTFSIPAAVGDRVVFNWTALLQIGASQFFDVCVIVGGAAVRYGATGTSSPALEGDPGLYPDTAFRASRSLGMALTVASGDLSGGNITFGFANINPGGIGKIFCGTNYPLRWQITNYGPAPS